MMFTFGPDPRKRRPPAAIVKKFKDKNIDPEGYTLYTYAAIQIWAQAAAEGQDHRRQEGRRGHQAAASWDTVLGQISYDKKGDITTLDYVVYKWEQGRQVRRDARTASPARKLIVTSLNESPPRQRGGLSLVMSTD